MKRLSVLLFALLLLTTAYATPSAVFDMDASGNAQMTITDTINYTLDEASLSGMADGSNNLVLKGSLTDSKAASNPDYDMQVTASGSAASVMFTMQVPSTDELLAPLGDFDATVAMTVSGGTLNIDISATMTKDAIENVLLLDVGLLEADPQGFKSDLESAVNEVFANMTLLPQKPQISITEFSISGSNSVRIALKMSISGWGEFMSILSALSYQNTSQSDFLVCLGLNPNDLVLSIMNADSTTAITVSSSHGSITGRVDVNAQQGNALGTVALSSLNAEISKSGSKTDIDASATVTDTQALLKCVMQGYLPGNYGVESVSYALAKSSGGQAMQSIEGKLTNLAIKSGGNLEVSFPAATTASMSITVNPPSGMDILSVSGGQKSGNSAVSSGSGEFKVVYGKGGFDLMLIAAIVIVVIALMLLLSRRKKK